MIRNRLTAAVLALTLALSLVAPVGATASSFSDITDSQTAINADVLRLMGVVDGVGNNQFSPSDTLTRGAFCKMLVSYMGLEDSLSLYETRTIFRDVPSYHWAAPYINLAASTSSGDEGMLISGVGNGTFQPDSILTYAQAVTILLRVLGYTDSDTGAIWPSGYLNLASSIGLTEGLSLSPDDHITRSEAAQLFVTALSSHTKDGSPYYETMGGTSTSDVMILATNVVDDGGQQGAIRTSIGTFLPQNDGVNPTALQGRRGVLVVSSKQQIIAFLPDDSLSTTITLSGGAQATYVLSTSGTRYSIASTTPVFGYGEDSQQSSYADRWVDFTSGTQLTLFLENGTVTAVYAGVQQLAEEAIVITSTPTRSTFYSITGGSTDFQIYRNGQEIGVTQIVTDDVVTYDALTNRLLVSDLRISAVYESASPNSTTPTSIHILGHDFPVLDSALAKSDSVKVGSAACFLLTADGSIAAIKSTSASRRSTAYGIAGESSVEIQLPAGGAITLSGANTISPTLQNALVTVSSYRADQLSATRISGNGAGTLDVATMTLGGRTIAPNFALYEEVQGGATVALDISSLDMASIPHSDIAAFRVDGSGNVDIIVLDGVTGDGYTYGMLVETAKDADAGIDNRLISVTNSGSGTTPTIAGLICTQSFTNGTFGGVAAGVGHLQSSGSYLSAAASVVTLTAIDGISRTDFFTVDGTTYVNANGTSYEMASQVECYNTDRKSWVTFSELRGYSDHLTIYIDPLGDTVRVVAGGDNGS